MELKILELFSGIGGMHYAFKYSKVSGQIIAAIDINTVANAVYAFNHKETNLMNNNIQKLNVKTLEKLQVNTILMSPPCQPHTRVGQKRDIEDKRSDALNHICELLPDCKGVQYVLMENVKGFEDSQARKLYVEALTNAGFYYREFIFSPTQLGIPNTRHRYYCLARKNIDFPFEGGNILTQMPGGGHNYEQVELVSLLNEESTISRDLLLDEKVLQRRVWLMDIVTSDAKNTMCFTKAYTHYSEGTGSIFCPLSLNEMNAAFTKLKEIEVMGADNDVEKEEKRLKLLKDLRLRYFSPREVARLMCFPETFDFPQETTNRQKYRLLGNSINVCVVGELIKLMCL